MTLVIPRPAYTPTIPSSLRGEDSQGFINCWQQRNTFNKETSHKSGAGNNTGGKLGGSEAQPGPDSLNRTSLLHLAIPNPGYISTTPSYCGSLPPRFPADSLLSSCRYNTNNTRPGTPTLLGGASSNMCGTTTGPCAGSSAALQPNSPSSSLRSSPIQMKRKLSLLDYEEDCDPRPKRISPFHNTPKQRRDEKRKILRMSIQKLRQIDDPEVFLRRSVLINNMTKRMQKELREEKRLGYGYYPSTFSSYGDFPMEQDCFYSSPRAHCKRFSPCSYEDSQQELESRLSVDSSHTSSSASTTCPSMTVSDTASSACSSSSASSSSSSSSSYLLNDPLSKVVDTAFEDPCIMEDGRPIEKLSDDLSDTLMRSVCGLSPSSDEDDQDEETSSMEQDIESCVSISDSSSEESSPPASPPSDTDMADSNNDSELTLSEMDKQILGEMDIVFNNLISVLSET